MKSKNRRLIPIGNSQGFIIPKEDLPDAIIGSTYNLEIEKNEEVEE